MAGPTQEPAVLDAWIVHLDLASIPALHRFQHHFSGFAPECQVDRAVFPALRLRAQADQATLPTTDQTETLGQGRKRLGDLAILQGQCLPSGTDRLRQAARHTNRHAGFKFGKVHGFIRGQHTTKPQLAGFGVKRPRLRSLVGYRRQSQKAPGGSHGLAEVVFAVADFVALKCLQRLQQFFRTQNVLPQHRIGAATPQHKNKDENNSGNHDEARKAKVEGVRSGDRFGLW